MGRGFVERYLELSREKESILCVGLDPAVRGMRQRFLVPQPLIERHGLREGVKRFCLSLIEAVSPYTPVIKPNAQYITYILTLEDLKELVEAIHEGGCLALLDAKLGDITSTNRAALHWIDAAGFDALTFSPYPGYEGGCDAIYQWAEQRDRGIFALCRMSNPGARDLQGLIVEGESLYLRVARDAYERGANGFVVGCTAVEELGRVRSIIGDEPLILSPGLGPQGGDPAAAIRLGSNSRGEGLIVASSRSIDYAYEVLGWSWERYAEAAAMEARKKRDELNSLRSIVFA